MIRTRLNVSRLGLLALYGAVLSLSLLPLAGCGSDRLEEGTTVEVSDDALADAEKSAEFYDQQSGGAQK